MRVQGWIAVLALAISGLLGGAIGAAIGSDDAERSPATASSTSSVQAAPSSTTTAREPLRPAFALCTHDQLEAGLGGSDGTAGTVVWIIVVANRGEPCSLQGWPHVTLLDRNGRELPVTVRQHLVRDAEPVDLFGTELPVMVNESPLVEAASVRIDTATDRGDVPGLATFRVDRLVLRLPGVLGSLVVATGGIVLAESVLLHPLSGPRGTIRD